MVEHPLINKLIVRKFINKKIFFVLEIISIPQLLKLNSTIDNRTSLVMPKDYQILGC